MRERSLIETFSINRENGINIARLPYRKMHTEFYTPNPSEGQKAYDTFESTVVRVDKLLLKNEGPGKKVAHDDYTEPYPEFKAEGMHPVSIRHFYRLAENPDSVVLMEAIDSRLTADDKEIPFGEISVTIASTDQQVVIDYKKKLDEILKTHTD